MEINLNEVRLHLSEDEKIVWSGQPLANILFSARDVFYIPFGILLLTLLITKVMVGKNDLIGFVFALFFAYFTFGRFITKYFNKKRTIYFLTNIRVIIYDTYKNIILQEEELDKVSPITKKIGRKGIGRVEFGKLSITQLTGGNSGFDFQARTKLYKKTAKMNTYWDEGADKWIPVFYDIKDAEFVYKLANELRTSQAKTLN